MINDDICSTLIAGTLEIDCQDIRLEQNTTASPRTFHGPGFIRCVNGRLVFRCYTDLVRDDIRDPFFPEAIVPGRFFAEEELYRFTAIDSTGKVWECPVVAPQVHDGSMHQNLIATGELLELIHSRENAVSIGNTWNCFTLYDPLEFPANSGTTMYEAVDGEEPHLISSSSDRFEFNLHDHKVLISGRKGATKVRVDSPVGDWEWIEKRVIECLQLAFAMPVNIAVVESGHGNRETTRLRPRPRYTLKSRLKRPIRFDTVLGADEVSALMDLYFRFIESHRQDMWHPVSMFLYAIIEASSCGPDLQALATSVAVEGIVNEAFNNRCVKSKMYVNLKNLAEQGKIQSEHVKIWSKVRNNWAHGAIRLDWESPKLANRIDTVLTLFYTLIFAAIGYRGIFADYSSPGWPDRRYPEGIRA